MLKGFILISKLIYFYNVCFCCFEHNNNLYLYDPMNPRQNLTRLMIIDLLGLIEDIDIV